jgi:hypothetical protein
MRTKRAKGAHNAGVEGSSPSLSTSKSKTSAFEGWPAQALKPRQKATTPDPPVTKSVTAKGLEAHAFDPKLWAKELTEVTLQRATMMAKLEALEAARKLTPYAPHPPGATIKVPSGPGSGLLGPRLGSGLAGPLAKPWPMPLVRESSTTRVTVEEIHPALTGPVLKVEDTCGRQVYVNTHDLPGIVKQAVEAMREMGWGDAQIRLALQPRKEAA